MSNNFFSTKKLLIYMLIIAVLIVFYLYNYFDKIDHYIYDSFQKIEYLSNINNKESDVTIIEVNELSLKKLGDLPLNRNYYVQSIQKLKNHTDNVIAFDILFSEAQEVSADSLMIDTLRERKNIVMPVKIEYSIQGNNSNQQFVIDSIKKPISSFENLVKLGHTSFLSDQDKKIRRLPPLFIEQNASYLPIARRAAELALQEEIIITEGEYLINYLGPSGTIPRISLHDFLDGNYRPELIEDNIIFIGITAGKQTKQFKSIFAEDDSFSQVQLLAQMTNNYLHQNYINVNKVGRNILIAFVLLWLAFYLFDKFNPYYSFIILILMVTTIGIVNYYLCVYYYLYTEISIYIVGFVVIYLSSLITWNLFNRKKKYAIVQKLKPYFSDYLLDEITKNPDMLTIEGNQSTSTLLYFEFRSFKRYSKVNSPEKVIEDLNHFYNNIVRIIFRYDGVIDKYLGDGILAYWNKDFQQDNHRSRAVKAALEIMNYIEQENIELEPALALDTGKIILGDIGSKYRVELKVIGDVVHNINELIEFTTSYEILVGENTYYGLSDIYKELNWKYKELKVDNIERSPVVYSLKDFKGLDID